MRIVGVQDEGKTVHLETAVAVCAWKKKAGKHLVLVVSGAGPYRFRTGLLVAEAVVREGSAFRDAVRVVGYQEAKKMGCQE